MYRGTSEQLLEIMRDPYASERYEEMGKFALRAALADHLALSYPDASAALLADLVDVNVSRDVLTHVANRLYAGGRMFVNKPDVKKRVVEDMRPGMATYALQVAGLFYMEANYDVPLFWEKYREHMEPLVGPEELEERRKAAKMFDTMMKSAIEAMPRYMAMYVKKRVRL